MVLFDDEGFERLAGDSRDVFPDMNAPKPIVWTYIPYDYRFIGTHDGLSSIWCDQAALTRDIHPIIRRITEAVFGFREKQYKRRLFAILKCGPSWMI